MTIQRYDNHSTEFGLWLRKQPEIDSSLGYKATNLDYIWINSRGEWMLIEEKRFGARPKQWQCRIYSLLDSCARNDPKYRGAYLIRFERTSPEDGRMWLSRFQNGTWRDEREITVLELLDFLKFKRNTSHAWIWTRACKQSV